LGSDQKVPSETFTSTLKVVVLFICIVWAGYFTNHFTSRLDGHTEHSVGLNKPSHYRIERRLDDKQLSSDVLLNLEDEEIESDQLSDSPFTQIQASRPAQISKKAHLQSRIPVVDHERPVSGKDASSNPKAMSPGPNSTHTFDVKLVLILFGSLFAALLLLAWCLAVWKSGGQCCGKKEKIEKHAHSVAEV